MPNPPPGVVFHWLGGLAAGSFYVPYRGVKHWSWETYWLAGGIFSWILAPFLFAWLMTRDLLGVVHATPGTAFFWVFFFGLLWGFGGLTFGLTMRYLGMSLGMAVVMGLCAPFGTLMPPVFAGEFGSKLLGTESGRVILLGIVVCLAGIALAGMAGMSKEAELSAAQKSASIEEFNFRRGLLVAVFSGVMSACFSYGLAAGDPIRGLTLARGTAPLWQGLPILVIILWGGFTTNFVWCDHPAYSESHRRAIFSVPLMDCFPGRAGGNRSGRSCGRSGRHTGQTRGDPRAGLGTRTAGTQLSPLCCCGNRLVPAVLLLHHGRGPNGFVQVLQLDHANGLDHSLQ